MDQQTINPAAIVGAYPVCGICKASAVLRDAWTVWNKMRGRWELQATFDDFHCDACGCETNVAWEIDKDFRTKRIRRLNDAFRHGEVMHGTLVLTESIQAFGEDVYPTIVNKVAEFSEFSEDNDPHQEHDFGSISYQNEKIFWKIDYFDRDMKGHSPDAANPDVTQRVLTIMLACEY